MNGSVTVGALLQASPFCVPVEQLPLLQLWPLLHAAQALPLVPQVLVLLPLTHVEPWQQPEGQVLALQLETHAVPLHTWPAPHAPHWLPPLPHALVDVPARHTVPLQQPDGHVVALQVGATHWPATQLKPEPHDTQLLPLPPHAMPVLPARHTLPSQQPVGQVVALQEPPLTH